jgi:Lamin Tail Domain
MRARGRRLAKGVFSSVLCLILAPLADRAWAASATLVINEIDYDQPGTDTAEFLELRNVSPSPIDLAGAVVIASSVMSWP